MYVDYDGRADVFRDRPRTITVSVGDQVLETFVDDAPGRQRRGLCASPPGSRDRARCSNSRSPRIAPSFPPNTWPVRRTGANLGLQVYEVEIREAEIGR